MRGRPLDITIEEDTQSLKELYRQEKDWRKRTRLHTLWLLSQEYSLTEISQLLGLCYRTLERWVSYYRQEGLSGLVARTQGFAARGHSSWLSYEPRTAGLREEASKGQFMRAQDVAEWIASRWGIRYTTNGIYSLLYRPQFRNKVPRPQSAKSSPEVQEGWEKGASKKRFLGQG